MTEPAGTQLADAKNSKTHPSGWKLQQALSTSLSQHLCLKHVFVIEVSYSPGRCLWPWSQAHFPSCSEVLSFSDSSAGLGSATALRRSRLTSLPPDQPRKVKRGPMSVYSICAIA